MINISDTNYAIIKAICLVPVPISSILSASEAFAHAPIKNAIHSCFHGRPLLDDAKLLKLETVVAGHSFYKR